MAVSLITEPASVDPANIDWQALLSKLVKICGGAGFTCRLTNWDTTAEPQVAQGSRFEINGSFYEVTSNESITGWAGISVGAIAYIYATPGSGTATFSYSSTAPTWDSAKGGWYNSTDRALFRLEKVSADSWSTKRSMHLTDGPNPSLDATTVIEYGIGSICKNISATDLDIVRNSGNFMGDNLTNAPLDSNDWFYIVIIKYSSTYCVQSAFGLNSAIKYIRYFINGIWTAWARDYTEFNVGTNWAIALSESAGVGSANGIDSKTVAGIDPVNGNAGTFGSQSIASTTPWVIPKGEYMAVGENSNIHLEIWSGSAWVGNGQIAGIIRSDGVNYRAVCTATFPTTYAVYYRKLA